MTTAICQPRTRLVLGNWKMHGSLADNARLLDALRQAIAQFGAQLRAEAAESTLPG